MAVNNPDGSSVTVNQPPAASGGAPAYTGVKWETEYEVDFADYFAANGGVDWRVAGHTQSHTLLNPGGTNVPWEAYADGATALTTKTTSLEINASGLQMGVPAALSNFWMGDTSAPRVGPFIAHAVEAAGGPIYNYYHDTVCMQAYITADVDPFVTNWQNMGVCLDIHTNSQGGDWLYARAVADSGSAWGSVVRDGTQKMVSTGPHPIPGSNPTLFEIVVGPRLASPRGRISDWAGSFPDPQTALNTGAGWAGVDDSAVIKDLEGPTTGVMESNPTFATGYLEVTANAAGSAVPFTMTVHKVRYLRLR
tara:strand:- start:166 stop:1089 length:924 start_codon:yes stop_codon:yes gene_type:complete